MKIKWFAFALVLLFSSSAIAQDGPQPPPPSPGEGRFGPPGAMMAGPMNGHHEGHEMGKWWQDSELAKKLQLTDAQITQLNQIFFDHRMKLIDDGAEMEKQDLKLQSLLDQDMPDTSQVGSQVDQVLAARGKLEREYTMMNLDLRKVLSVAQWRQLKSAREQHGPPRLPFPPGGGPDGHGPNGPVGSMNNGPVPPPGPGDN